MRWRCLGSGMDQLGNEDESVTHPKPYDIPKRRVLEAYRRVRANRGVAGIDGVSLEMFEADLTGNLYKLWNRLSSGSYFPSPVKQVEIPKKNGGVRVLGVPTMLIESRNKSWSRGSEEISMRSFTQTRTGTSWINRP